MSRRNSRARYRAIIVVRVVWREGHVIQGWQTGLMGVPLHISATLFAIRDPAGSNKLNEESKLFQQCVAKFKRSATVTPFRISGREDILG